MNKPKSKKQTKRILSVTVKRMADDSPDSSYLGEYSNRPETEYAIDRAHSEDCILNDVPQKEKLERIADYLENSRDIACEEHIDSYEPNTTCEACKAEIAHTNAIDTVRALTECDCGSRRHYDSREYRYFNGNVANYKGESPENIRKYVRQDYERMESLQRGDWCYIGIRAEARIAVGPGANEFPLTKRPVSTQTITSGGLYGIESDSDKPYLESIEQEELSELKTQLLAIGFTKRAIATAFKNVEHNDE